MEEANEKPIRETDKPTSPVPPHIYLQDTYLKRLIQTGRLVFIYLSNGGKLLGKVQRFDAFCILFFTRNRQVLIFKHAIISIKPQKPTGEDGIFRLQKKENGGKLPNEEDG